MSSAFRITAFAVADEPVILMWLHKLHLDRNDDWALTAVLRGQRSGRKIRAEIPFGMAPVLSPGRVYNDGVRSETMQIGELRAAVITSLQDAEAVPLSAAPPALFSDGRRRDSDQKLLLCRTPGLDIYIPPLELVRRLFLHDRVLANVILRRGGLADLWAPVPPGFPDELLVEFTRAMPLRILSERFVREFAWLAVHPTGAASWNSVARLSNPQDGVMLRPPKVGGFTMTFRGLFGGGAALVYEILSLPCKTQRFKRLDYTHPALKENAPHGGPAAVGKPEGKPRRLPEKVEKEFDIEGEASRVRGDPAAADMLRPGSDFAERYGTVHRRRIPRAPQLNDRNCAPIYAQTEYGTPSDVPRTPSGVPQRRVVKVTVSDIATTPMLPPLSFRVLQLASPDYIGDLGPLLDTLRRIRKLLPQTVHMATSLCAMPETSPLAWSGPQRRPCLVAIFSPADRPPIVLLEVDHSGINSLSALSLHARRKTQPENLDVHINAVLGRLESGGRWPTDLERVGDGDFTVQRIKRMLRRRNRAENADYQTRWAAMLVKRLGLE